MTATSDFLDRLSRDVLTINLSLQTLLVEEYEKPMEEHLSQWVLDHPADFQDALRRFYALGGDIGHTGTQANSKFRSQPFGQEVADRIYELNQVSAKLAREVTPEDRYIAGNMDTTNPDFMEPVGDLTYDEVYENNKGQIEALVEGGVNVLVVAGAHMDEALVYIKIAKDLTDLPVIGLNAFFKTKHGFRTLEGLDPKTATISLDKGGADVVGLICGLVSFEETGGLLRQIREGTDKPLAATPDAGLAQLVGDDTVWPATAEDSERFVPEWIDAGARVVGGCCGTNYDHYRALVSVAREHSA